MEARLIEASKSLEWAVEHMASACGDPCIWTIEKTLKSFRNRFMEVWEIVQYPDDIFGPQDIAQGMSTLCSFGPAHKGSIDSCDGFLKLLTLRIDRAESQRFEQSQFSSTIRPGGFPFRDDQLKENIQLALDWLSTLKSQEASYLRIVPRLQKEREEAAKSVLIDTISSGITNSAAKPVPVTPPAPRIEFSPRAEEAELMTLEGLAEMLGISVQTLRNQKKRGRPDPVTYASGRKPHSFDRKKLIEWARNYFPEERFPLEN